ncbi:NAD(P)-dependent dehydrogenase (short-subunit alcohol dehydrogenase family) [Rhizobium sp. BK512]|nr:NAD(P)-dependent dehydrogenase (short-subunit alcohol dehydrogenase family) [Rhizobium sp. BK512]
MARPIIIKPTALGEDGQKAFASMTPLQRMADPAEIGAVAAFLASPDSSFMTASEVAVDGGLANFEAPIFLAATVLLAGFTRSSGKFGRSV